MPTIQIHNPSITRIGLRAASAFCRALAVQELQCPGIIATYDGLQDPILNVVMDTQVSEEELEAVIVSVFDFYQRLQVDWRWIVGPLSMPTTLSEQLHKHDLIIYETYPAMYFDLTQSLPVLPPIEMEIKAAQPRDCLTDWIQAIRESFPTTDKGEGYRSLCIKKLYGPDALFHHFVGYVAGEPIASGTLFVNQDAVMIHNIAVKPAFRHRGFGTSITLHAMQIGASLGAKHCFLDASEQGFELYQKLGFQVYSKHDVYGPSLRFKLSKDLDL